MSQPSRRRPMILVLLGAGALLGATLLSRPFWQAAKTSNSDVDERHGQDDQGVQFDAASRFGPAFAPDAGVEDLREEVQQAAQRLIAAFPSEPDALNVQARVYYGLGDRSEAVRLWEQCIELSPDYVDAYHGMASCAYDQGDCESAASWSRKGMKLDQRDMRFQAILAETLLKMNRLQELIVELEPILRTGTLSAETGVPLGQAFLQRREYENAQRAFEAVLAAAPDDDRLCKQAHYGLATLYATLGQQEKSREHRRQFLELSDVDLAAGRERIRTTLDLVSIRGLAVGTHKACARVYSNQGRPTEAEEMWLKTTALAPQDVESRTELALIYEKTDRERQALHICKQLRDIDPSNPDHWLNIALLNARLYRLDEALAAVDKAIQLAPDNQKYRHARKTIQSTR